MARIDMLRRSARAAALAALVIATGRLLLGPGGEPPAAASLPIRPQARAVSPLATPVSVALTTTSPAPASSPVLTVRRVLDVAGPIRIGDYRWDEAGAPAGGPVVLTVDLAAGVLSIFRDGYEIGTAAIVYGGDTKPTPLGVFPITQKDAHHISNLYHAEMPYMQRLTNDGVTIHGTEGIRSGWATHGCVGVPVAFARKLFGATHLGDPVIVTSGKRLALGQAIVSG